MQMLIILICFQVKSSSARSLPPLCKWNGKCIYDSGYPSLMVGDSIESASEDEEFWEKKLASIVRAPHVKRHGMQQIHIFVIFLVFSA